MYARSINSRFETLNSAAAAFSGDCRDSLVLFSQVWAFEDFAARVQQLRTLVSTSRSGRAEATRCAVCHGRSLAIRWWQVSVSQSAMCANEPCVAVSQILISDGRSRQQAKDTSQGSGAAAFHSQVPARAAI